MLANPPRPGQKPAKPMEHRVKIIAETQIAIGDAKEGGVKAMPLHVGTVLDVTPQNSLLLRSGNKAVRVADDEPLHIAPPPIDPNTQRPARFLELVTNGLNTVSDLANELNTSKGNVVSIAARSISEGTIKINDRGVYVLAKKAA